MSDEPLTTEQVRNAFSQTGVWLPRISYPEYGAEFDRWLTAHDADLAARLAAAEETIEKIRALPREEVYTRDQYGTYPTIDAREVEAALSAYQPR